MMLYNKAEKGDPIRNLDYLLKILDKSIAPQRKEGNRQTTSKVDPASMLRPDGEGKPKAATAGKGKGKDSTNIDLKNQLCFDYANGICKYQDTPHLCPRSHDPEWAISWHAEQNARRARKGVERPKGLEKGKAKPKASQRAQ